MSTAPDERLWRSVPAVRHLVVELAGIQALSAGLTVAQAVVLADVIVAIFLRGDDVADVLPRLLLLAGVGCCRALLAAVQELVAGRVSTRVRTELRAIGLHAVRQLGPGWAQQQPAGRLVTAVGPGLELLDGYLTRALPALTAACAVPPIVLIAIGVADWQSAVILILALPLVPLFMALIGVTTRRRMERQYAALAEMAGRFLDLLRGLTTLRVYGQARRQIDTVRRSTVAYRRRTMSTLRVAFLSGLVLDLIATLSVAVVAVDVGLRLDGSHLALRTALIVLLLTPELFAPLRAVGAQYHAGEEGRVAAAAVLDIGAETATSAPLAGSTAAPRRGGISLRDVVVSYPQRDGPVLDIPRLDLSDGEVVAVVGPSGGGKSTLVALLLRFVDATEGGAVIRGESVLSEVDPVAWRRIVAWMPQRPRPSQPTVADEVRLGDPEATDAAVAEVIALCRAPSADTALGEDGRHLSAGQRRRVALARVVLRAQRVRRDGAVPLVLLDEPTEDLDRVNEQIVSAVIGRLAGWATVVVVTHSNMLSGIADRRVVLDRGKVARQIMATGRRDVSELAGPIRVGAEAEPVQPQHQSSHDQRGAAAQVLDLRSDWPRLLGAALLSAGAGLAGLALTATSIWLICRAAQQPNVQALGVAVVGVRTFALGRALLRYGERLVGHDAALRLLSDVRSRVFAALIPLTPGGLGPLRRGDLLRRFVSDVDGAQDLLVRGVIPAVGATLTASGAVFVAGLILPSAGLALAVGLIVGGIGAPLLARAVAGAGTVPAAAAAVRDVATSAAVDALPELVAYGADGKAVAAVRRADHLVQVAARRPVVGGAVGTALGGIAAAASMATVLALATNAVAGGALDPLGVGVLVACVLAGFDAAAGLPVAFAAWSRNRAGLHRIADLLASPVPMPEPVTPALVRGPVVDLRAVCVALAPALEAPTVLSEVNVNVRAGTRVAVMGPSGCGKSTLLATALRLLPVRAGRLDVIDDGTVTPLARIPSEDVPPLISGSLQGDHIFNTSLRDNLRVVRPDAGDADLDHIAERAGLRQFIRSLPEGWATRAGPDGDNLSGGQRQRLLLARALLAAPAVLILDEPTAHLDSTTEHAVLTDLLDTTRGQTVLLSTHRRIPDDQVDQVIYLDGSR